MIRMRIKVCCMASPAEAEMAVAAGADLIGLVGPMPSGPGIITARGCREIADIAPAWTTPVLLTESDTVEAVIEDVRKSNVRAIQLVRHVDPALHIDLARDLPGVRRLQVIHVEDRSALDMISAYGDGPDAYLLDSGRPSQAELGGTGRVHDWSISADFVAASPLPVFLAGGLNPGNVAAAIRQVRPFGIDVCSGLRTDDRLDPKKLAAFMAEIDRATREAP